MYDRFAAVYDRLMSDVPYDRYAAVFFEAVDFTGVSVDRVLDLGCGTGAMFPHLFRRARSVVGVDLSASMLAVAAAKHVQWRQRLTLMEARASDLAVRSQVDACVAICDVVNYFVEGGELQASFAAVRRALRPGGLFFFDAHTPRKIREEIGNNVYFDLSENAAAIMSTAVEPDEGLVQYDLTVFARASDGRYERSDETHWQRGFSLEAILAALGAAGFRQVYVGADFVFDYRGGPGATSEFLRQTGMAVAAIASFEKMDRAARWFFAAQ